MAKETRTRTERATLTAKVNPCQLRISFRIFPGREPRRIFFPEEGPTFGHYWPYKSARRAASLGGAGAKRGYP